MDSKRFVLATRNSDKINEIKEILKEEEWELLSLMDFPKKIEAEESGETLRDNALIKARSSFQITGIASVADDSGLEVDQLKGAPGVLSSRFAGDKASYYDNNEKLLRLLNGIPLEERTARFRCVAALVDEEKECCVEGVCEGVILKEYCGINGFGYDPIFYVPEKGMTFAEMSTEEKNEISHRGVAFRKMADLLRKL